MFNLPLEEAPSVEEALAGQAIDLRRRLNLPEDADLGAAVQVPIYEGHLSAGPGGEPSDRLVGFGGFLKRWLREVMDIRPDRAFMAEARGYSMVPLIGNRDLVVGEKREELERDDVYAFHWRGQLHVKHVRRSGSELHLISENSAFDPEIVRAEEADDFHLIGVVRGKVTRPYT